MAVTVTKGLCVGLAVVFLSTIAVTRAHAQSITTEAAVTAGTSTDDATVLATQLRAFGDLNERTRFFVEGAWGRTSNGESDAFGSAYPYRDRVQLVEAYGEWQILPRGGLVNIRTGQYRSPFGIYNASDHAYTGFLRAPLIRYDDYFAWSNNYVERGADLLVGSPHLTVETSLGVPADLGDAIRRHGLDIIVRAQGSGGPFVVGVSYGRTLPYLPAQFAHGHTAFTGVDVRWMRDGVQVRGEWLGGQPFNGTTTTGWYSDVMVHRVGMGPITAVARVERLDYDTIPRFAVHARRETVGARVRVMDRVSVQVNLLHSTGALDANLDHAAALDIGVSYSVRHQANGGGSR